MALLFNDASSQYLTNANALVTAAPLTMACWFNSDDITLSQVLMSIDDTGAGGHRFQLVAAGATAGDPVSAQTVGTGGATGGNSTTGYSANIWYHACGVWAATNSRSGYINGGSKGTETTNITVSSLDTTAIGARYSAAWGAFMSGMIADAAIWNVALNDNEVASLAKGVSPLLIRPDSLVAYWPLYGRVSPEPDLLGGYLMALNNAPTQAAHPGMVKGYGKIYAPGIAAGGGGLSIPVVMLQYRQRWA